MIGIKDQYRGEAPKAFIKLKAGMTATEADIRKHLESKLSKIEMPAQIEFRDALPKTMIGKLSKKELKAEEEARRKADLSNAATRSGHAVFSRHGRGQSPAIPSASLPMSSASPPGPFASTSRRA